MAARVFASGMKPSQAGDESKRHSEVSEELRLNVGMGRPSNRAIRPSHLKAQVRIIARRLLPSAYVPIMAEQLPVIDLAAYYAAGPWSPEAQRAIQAIHAAASTWGFFLLTGTAVSPQTQSSLLSISRAFFDLPLGAKMALDVRSGGVAWRGYMPLGGEHTHGRVDWKEGLYVGPEHADDHPLAGLPLHGQNQFPDQLLPGMRHVVLEYVGQVTELGKTLTDVFSLGLGLGEDELRKRLLEPEPVVLCRCFKYAPVEEKAVEESKEENGEEGFGIGEHTDFGYLTILKVDSPGLQILSPSDQWVDVPCVENSFVVNESDEEKQLAKQRWAATTFREVKGTWSQYLARKVQKVFPDLGLPDFEPNAAPSTRFTRVVELRST
ncbi:Isopenicillin N synthase-like protein [Tolypocladium paradoxum]|uniref:Isopenicillin N synthase-like protein n=1 Tax=Tolypocladium paradoxum TaxID=94208 RepID=A0A2S4LAT2_9HYPO|nr:Isopenicillin N synthase-like protein [Tolypocladium paradoxum]